MLRLVSAFHRNAGSVGPARFARSVLASVLAAGVAAVAFSRLSHEPAPPVPDVAHSKTFDRLTWKVEEVPTRSTRTYDALAMFALPMVQPAPWREQDALAEVPQPVAPIKLARADRPERDPHRGVVLPPSRPAPAKAGAEARPGGASLAPAGRSEPRPSGLTILGWQVPGTERVPSLLPDSSDVMRRAAQFGGKVTGMGQELAEAVGLK
jgi:hypothetical protein